MLIESSALNKQKSKDDENTSDIDDSDDADDK